jgi:hypothetical protein
MRRSCWRRGFETVAEDFTARGKDRDFVGLTLEHYCGAESANALESTAIPVDESGFVLWETRNAGFPKFTK